MQRSIVLTNIANFFIRMLCSFNTINQATSIRTISLPAIPNRCLNLKKKKRITAYQRHICLSSFDTHAKRKNEPSHIRTNKTFAMNPFMVCLEGVWNFAFFFHLLTTRWVNFKCQHSYSKMSNYSYLIQKKICKKSENKIKSFIRNVYKICMYVD